jgi:hypothetical protein
LKREEALASTSGASSLGDINYRNTRYVSLTSSVPMRRFPPPWTIEALDAGYKVVDANGQTLAYVYSRESASDAHMAKVLTEDEARRIAANIAKLPSLLLRRAEKAAD